MPRGVRPRVDGIACGLDGQQHLRAIVAGQGLLHFVHDQDQVGAGQFDHFRERLRQRDAALGPHLIELKAELEAGRPHVHALEARQAAQHARSRCLQVGQRTPYGRVHQGGRVGLGVGPQVDIDDDGAFGLQRGDQVLAQKGRLAGAPQARQEQARAQPLVEQARLQQLFGHLLGQCGAVKQVHLAHFSQNR